MAIIPAVITPVAVQAFQITATVSPNTYQLVAGVIGKSIRIMSYSLTSSSGTVILQDSAGVVITTVTSTGGIGSTGVTVLTQGADLQAIVTATTDITCYFVGFVA